MIRHLALAAALAATGAAPLSAEIVETSDTHFVTRDSAVVDANAADVWMALISPAKWWTDAHSWSGDAANMTLVPQGGGCFCERLVSADSENSSALAGSARHMTVIMADPGKVLRMRGGLGPLQSEPADGVLTISLAPEGADGTQTRITWEYVVGGAMRYPIATIAPAVDGVMSQQLAGLATHLGGAIDKGAPAEDEGSGDGS